MQRNIINESLKLSKLPKLSLVTFQTKQTTAGRNVPMVNQNLQPSQNMILNRIQRNIITESSK